MRSGAMLAAALGLVALWSAAWPFTVDDAAIAARYAVRLAHGLGYTFNPGPATDGVTGPLWLVPLVLAAWAGGDVLLVGKLCGALASLAALGAVLARVRVRAQGRTASWVAAAVGCTSLPFAVWSVAGLETGCATLAASALGLAVTARPTPRPYLAAITAGALWWLRPELMALACVLWCGLALRARDDAMRAGVLLLALVGALVALRLALFGHVLPMSVAAKPALLASGVAYVGDVLLRPRALACAWLVAFTCKGAPRDARLIALALMVQLGALALAGGDWMPGHRLVAPLLPLFALYAARALPRLALRRRGLALLLALATCGAGALELAATLGEVRAAGLRQRREVPRLARVVCGAHGPVALVDVGAVGLACVRQPLLDLGGLTEPRIAYAPGGHLDKRLDPDWLAARAPALVVLHSRERPRIDDAGRVRWFAGYPVERRLLALPFIRDGYRARGVLGYAPDYHYVLLTPK